MSRWKIAHLSEIEPFSGPGTLQWTPIRRHFDIGAFGITAYVAAEAGQDVVERHAEKFRRHEEVYVVLSGRARFILNGDEVDAASGTIIFVREPEVERFAVASEPGTTVLAIGGRPGAPYGPGAWEPVYAARALGSAGDYDAAIAELNRGLALHSEHPMLLYHLASWEALAGRRDDALAHLAQATAGNEHLAERAQAEDAFSSILEDDRFPAAP